MTFKSELIEGGAADVPHDTFHHATPCSMLDWRRKSQPGTCLYEMIHLGDCGDCRARVGQWFGEARLTRSR